MRVGPAARGQGALERHQVLDGVLPGGQVGQPVAERGRGQVGEEAEPAEVDAEHGRGPVAPSAGPCGAPCRRRRGRWPRRPAGPRAASRPRGRRPPAPGPGVPERTAWPARRPRRGPRAWSRCPGSPRGAGSAARVRPGGAGCGWAGAASIGIGRRVRGMHSSVVRRRTGSWGVWLSWRGPRACRGPGVR